MEEVVNAGVRGCGGARVRECERPRDAMLPEAVSDSPIHPHKHCIRRSAARPETSDAPRQVLTTKYAINSRLPVFQHVLIY